MRRLSRAALDATTYREETLELLRHAVGFACVGAAMGPAPDGRQVGRGPPRVSGSFGRRGGLSRLEVWGADHGQRNQRTGAGEGRGDHERDMKP